MKNLGIIIGGIGIFIAVLLGTYLGANKQESQPISFGSLGSPYIATSTDSTYQNTKRQFKSTSGLLGSVIVTGTSATIVEIKNATSTTDIASTTIAIFAASPATGTYTFDSSFDRGLAINFLGSFTGKYTITYR